MNLLKLISINVEENEKENFRKNILIDNLRRGKVFTEVVISLEIILSLIDIVTSVLKVHDKFLFNEYLFMYLFMIFINIVFLIFIEKNQCICTKTDCNIKKGELGLIIYITLIMVWGSCISLMDQGLYGQLMAFMMNMITVSVIFYLDTKKLLIPFSISVLLLFFGLPFFQKSTDILIGHYVNLSVFCVETFIVSRILYLNYYNDFKSKELLKKANEKLQELTLIDELTGIPNRRSFNNFIDFAYEFNLKEDSTISIIMMDIDYFKQYNDNYGHSAGDKVLISVAQKINSIAKDHGNFVARFGGEEFILAAIDTMEQKILNIAEIIRTSILNLKIPHDSSKVAKYISISLGISTAKVKNKDDIFKCIELADKALYVAKAEGRNCFKNINCYLGEKEN